MSGLSLAEAGARLGLSRSRVRQLVMEGRLRAEPLEAGGNGRQSWAISEAEVERFSALVRAPGRPAFVRRGAL